MNKSQYFKPGSRYCNPNETPFIIKLGAIVINEELELEAFDSDPYDAVVFKLSGIPKAVKYVENWEKEADYVKNNLDAVLSEIRSME